MPRDGILSDFQSPTVSIVCEPCRRGSYAVAKLIDEHGDEHGRKAFTVTGGGFESIVLSHPRRPPGGAR